MRSNGEHNYRVEPKRRAIKACNASQLRREPPGYGNPHPDDSYSTGMPITGIRVIGRVDSSANANPWARQLHIPRPTPTYKRCFGHHTVQGRVMEGIRQSRYFSVISTPRTWHMVRDSFGDAKASKFGVEPNSRALLTLDESQTQGVTNPRITHPRLYTSPLLAS